MLVLSRKYRERLILFIPPGFVVPPSGVEIPVQAVEIRGDKVRIGVTAPSEIKVNREEVWDNIKEESALS